MKKVFIAMTLSFFATQAAYSAPLSSVQPAPVKGVQAAKDDATCKSDWTINSKGKDYVKFAVGGFVGVRSFTKDNYIKACKEGTLPATKPMS
ncbi:MAG: hypothetical protein Q8S31_10210 [Alphaproteobacteria bacterium]|nr:hypothetical protein [Alphaproteobacteria bacterium]